MEEDLKCAPRVLCASSAEELFIIRALSGSLRAARQCIFTGGGTPSVLPLRVKPPSPRGRLWWWRETLRQRQKLPPERKDFPRSGGRCRVATKGGIWHRAAMTERVKPSPWGRWLRPTGADGRGAPPERADFPSFRPESHVLGRKSQTIKQNAQKGGAKFGGGGLDRSWGKIFEKR